MLTGEFQMLEFDIRHCGKEKARIDEQSGPSAKFYPTDAVQVNLPFPFGKRRMTVAAESDFQ
jgi:hypothetical protein